MRFRWLVVWYGLILLVLSVLVFAFSFRSEGFLDSCVETPGCEGQRWPDGLLTVTDARVRLAEVRLVCEWVGATSALLALVAVFWDQFRRFLAWTWWGAGYAARRVVIEGRVLVALSHRRRLDAPWVPTSVLFIVVGGVMRVLGIPAIVFGNEAAEAARLCAMTVGCVIKDQGALDMKASGRVFGYVAAVPGALLVLAGFVLAPRVQGRAAYDAADELKMRLARGEITLEEYQQTLAMIRA